nr:3-hydroxybutyryl-CoA dehydrogenase [uncultured bacterium]
MSEPPTTHVVAVIGAGVIGTGVAQAGAEAGHRVVLVDREESILDRARADIRRNLAAQRLLAKGDAPAPEDVLARVDGTTAIADVGRASFVVENVTERWAVKEPVWRDLARVCSPDAVLAANTSAIPIAKLAALTGDRADKVIGIHFMNPVPLKDAVEVIRGPETSEATVAQAIAFLATMGKEGLVVRDAPGFVSNRVLMLTINEALAVLDDGVADAETIDAIFTRCFGHAMGPLATADLIGLDTIADTLDVLHAELGDDRFRAAPLLTKLVGEGRLGRKAGGGVFDYPGRRA